MNLAKIKRVKGFTLIELMIVVAIIGILAAVAIPKFGNLIAKSKESAVKGNLGALRSALSIYYGDTEGVNPPAIMVALTTGDKYLSSVSGAGDFTIPPNARIGSAGHTGGLVLTDADDVVQTTVADGSAGDQPVCYVPATGIVVINCTHKDDKGAVWSSY